MATHSNTLAWVNSMDRGAWRVTVHGVTKSQTRLRKHTQFLQNRECKKVKRERESVSHSVMSNSVTPLVEAHQAPLSMDFSRQEYWSGLSIPSPENLPAVQEMQETWVRSLGCKDPLEKKMATHSSVLAWRIPWTEEPGGLQSRESQRVGCD